MSSGASLPADFAYATGEELCVCGYRLDAHAGEQGALVVRDRGRLRCCSFYSRADLEWGRQQSARQAAERAARDAQAADQRLAAKQTAARRKAARDAKKGVRPGSAFD